MNFFGKIFHSVGHIIAWLLHIGLPKAESAVQQAAAVLQTPLALALASLLGPQAAAVQSALEAIAGNVLAAFQDAGQAISAGGLNVQFDQKVVADIEMLFGLLQQATVGIPPKK